MTSVKERIANYEAMTKTSQRGPAADSLGTDRLSDPLQSASKQALVPAPKQVATAPATLGAPATATALESAPKQGTGGESLLQAPAVEVGPVVPSKRELAEATLAGADPSGRIMMADPLVKITAADLRQMAGLVYQQVPILTANPDHVPLVGPLLSAAAQLHELAGKLQILDLPSDDIDHYVQLGERRHVVLQLLSPLSAIESLGSRLPAAHFAKQFKAWVAARSADLATLQSKNAPK